MDEQMADLRWGPDDTVPAVVQDVGDGTVLMLLEMNREALDAALRTGVLHACSRTQRRPDRGEASGQGLRVVDVKCSDGRDTLLVQVRRALDAVGPPAQFSRSLAAPMAVLPGGEVPGVTEMPAALYDLILSRRETGDETSYVRGLFRRGHDVICKKVAEEAAEVVIASKNQAPDEVVYEMADLWFHATVLLGYHTIHPHAVWRELRRRFGQAGGGKAPAAETASG